MQVANRVKEVVKNSRCEYQTIIGHKTAAIHPASVLFQRKPYPDAIVYTISKLEKGRRNRFLNKAGACVHDKGVL